MWRQVEAPRRSCFGASFETPVQPWSSKENVELYGQCIYIKLGIA